MLRPLLALLLLGSAALAEGEAPPDGVPTRAVPCAMLDATLHADGGDPVVCSKDGCFKPDMWRNTAIRHPRPAAQPDWLGPVARVGDDQVCLGTTCRKLGRKLAAAVAEARKGEQPILSATTDLKAVVVGETAWNLQADQPLTFVAPPFYRNQRTDRPVVRGIFPAGDLLVVWWSACAGPCTRFAIADSAGRAKGPEGEGAAASSSSIRRPSRSTANTRRSTSTRWAPRGRAARSWS